MDAVDIRLFVSDVDGTLLDLRKEVTPATRGALEKLQRANIQFALITSRPPRGLKWLIDLLAIQNPCGALNGAVIVDSGLTVISVLHIRSAAVPTIVEALGKYGMDVWLYTETDWYVFRLDARHVHRESDALRFLPTPIDSLHSIRSPIVKIVGISDDYEMVSAGIEWLESHWGDQLSLSRPQPNRIDVTNIGANKGRALIEIARTLNIPLTQVAAAGDGENDIPMFRESFLSIAMGQAPVEVHRAASYTTTSNAQDGLAWAIEKIVLKNR
jgi:hypothetical protein